MNREEILELIKENLTIVINKERTYDYDSTATSLIVELKLGEETISTEYVYID